LDISWILFSRNSRGRLSIWDVCYQTPLAVLQKAGLEKDQP